jgi:hypothetical protein
MLHDSKPARVYPDYVKIAVLIVLAASAWGHDVITTKITFDREIARIVYARCASCHKQGGSAFSLMTYSEARPWAKAIQEEVLERRMPPWGAVKGFGEFRDEQALTPEQIEVIADWVEGGSPEGDEKDLPPPPKPAVSVTRPEAPVVKPGGSGPFGGGRYCIECAIAGDLRLTHGKLLAGLQPSKVAAGASFQITAELPDGSILPLLWLEPFKPAFEHAYWFKNPIQLPAGTVIRGVPPQASVEMLTH